MKKRILSIVLAVCIMALMLPAGIVANAELHIPDVRDFAPQLFSGYYDPETTVMTASFTTEDVDSRYFESFLLVREEIENAMGQFTIKGVVYYILGIMSFDADDASHVSVDKAKKTVTLSQETYFGMNHPPQQGSEVYIAVQTEGSHDGEDNWGEGSEVSEPWQFLISGPAGEPPLPENVKVYVKSMEEGKVQLDGGVQAEGTVASLEITFNKQYGRNHFFVTPVKMDNSKVLCGTKPFIHVYSGYPAWGDWYFSNEKNEEVQLRSVNNESVILDGSEEEPMFAGPNDEQITQTVDSYTVQMKVVRVSDDSDLKYLAYSGSEDIIIGVANGNSSFSTMSELVTVEIPFNENSVGKTFESFVPEALTNTSTISANAIAKGEKVTVSASATGGVAPYQYAVFYKKESSKSYTTVSASGANDTVVIKPASTGIYDVLVKVKDAKGNAAKKTFKLTVFGIFKDASSVSADEIIKGGTVTVNAAATGGMGGYQYAVLYKKESSTKYSTASSYSDKQQVVIKPGATGVYDILVMTKDSSGNVVKGRFKVTVYAALKNTSEISASIIPYGETVTVNASATGGMGGNQYTVLYKKASSPNYTTVSKYSDKQQVVIKPGANGKYDIVVKVKDKTGNAVRKQFSLTVTVG